MERSRRTHSQAEAVMLHSDTQIRARAAALAEEVAAGIAQGRVAEWVEEVLGAALLAVAREERGWCAALAYRRAEMWEASAHRRSSGGWPASALVEARERRNEALALADALHADAPTPER
jgi:hypothetical protein